MVLAGGVPGEGREHKHVQWQRCRVKPHTGQLVPVAVRVYLMCLARLGSSLPTVRIAEHCPQLFVSPALHIGISRLLSHVCSFDWRTRSVSQGASGGQAHPCVCALALVFWGASGPCREPVKEEG